MKYCSGPECLLSLDSLLSTAYLHVASQRLWQALCLLFCALGVEELVIGCVGLPISFSFPALSLISGRRWKNL